MKRKRSFMIMGILLIMIFLIFPLSGSAKDVIEIKAATFHPVQHRLTEDAFKWYGNEIEKRTNGRVKFKWFLASSLVKPPHMHKALQSGLADFATPVTGWFPNLFLITAGLNLPFVVDSSLHAAVVSWEMYETIPEMKKEYSKMKPLGFFSTAIQNIHTVGPPPKTLEELKGRKVGCAGGGEIHVIKALGGSPHHLKLGDMYMALQRGMIDSLLFPNAPLRSYKLTETLNGHTMGNMLVATFALAMSLDAWEKLPPDIQKTFEDFSISLGALCGATLTNESEWVIDALKKRGDQFCYLPPQEKARWKKRVQPLYDEWIAKLDSKGMNGKTIFDKMMAISEKWRKNPYKPDAWWGRAGRK